MTENDALTILRNYRCSCKEQIDLPAAIPEDIDNVIAGIIELKKYRNIGSLEDFREALDKQMPKKLVYDMDSVYYNGFTQYRMLKCPICGKHHDLNDDVNYCSNCGQAITFEEDL